MTENNNNQWNDDTLRVNDEGHVEGQAWAEIDDEHDVSVSVFSYNFEQYGETKTNHVPHVVVTTRDGSIVSEPEAHDSTNPQKAIKNARSLGEYIMEYPEDFLE